MGRLHLPSLHQEISPFLAKFGIVDVTQYSKETWRRLVKRSINELNRIHILNQLKNYKKVDYFEIASEEFKFKDYFNELNLELARLKFRSRALTMSSCSTHYPNHPEYIKNVFKYHEKGCLELDTILHWETSKCYENLKISGMLSNDEELCQFYKRVIQHRMDSVGIRCD